MINLQRNDHYLIGDVEQPKHLAESRNSSGWIPCSRHRRKHAIETVKEVVMKHPRILRLAANLTPSNTVVNEVVSSTQRQQPSRHEDGLNINVEEVNVSNSTS